MNKKPLLKEILFNTQTVGVLASEIKTVYSDFDKKSFETEVLEAFQRLELKERLSHIRQMLFQYLPDAYETAVYIILNALPAPLDPGKKDDDFGHFIYASYSEYVAVYGCKKEYLELSFSALREITKRFSAEYAVRDFLNAFPAETLHMLKQCSLSENYHERRLASEGTRPKLPWGKKTGLAPQESLELLENLYTDTTRFVTRSVANHLNDISKTDPSLAILTLQRWKASEKQEPEEMAFILKHALRTLVKEGNAEALALLGYRENPHITIRNFSLGQSAVSIGESLHFTFEIEAERSEQLWIDYLLHYRTKTGKRNVKVHRVGRFKLADGEVIQLQKTHLFKANMTTRKLYEGEHKVELQINGKIFASRRFQLKQK